MSAQIKKPTQKQARRTQKKEEHLVRLARRYVGAHYKYGAYRDEAPDYFDCSSYVQRLYKAIGITLPRNSIDQARLGRKVQAKTDGSNLKVGDLIFFTTTKGRYDKEFPEGIGHVGAYIGGGRFAHATTRTPDGTKESPKRDQGVRLDPIEVILARNDVVVIKRILH